MEEIRANRPGEWEARIADVVNFRAPGGESLGELAARVVPAISDIAARHRGEDVLVVAHGGVNRVILMDAIGAPISSFFNIEQRYCCLNIIDYYADGNSVVQLANG